MNKKFTKLIAAVALLTLLIPMRGWGQTRAEEVYKTALFGSSYNSTSINNYTSTWTATNDGFTVSLTNFNNNQNGWDYVKCGRKNNASVATIITSAVIDVAITKVDVTIDGITAANVNSIKLYTSSDNSTWTEAGSYDKSTGTKSVSLSSPVANLYYKVEFDCASGSSNGLVTVSKVEYYYNAGSTTYTVTYDGNGATSGTAPTDATAYSSGATVTVLGNTGSLEKTGCTFGGWNTQADGQGTNYTAGNTFSITANTTLYAKWTDNRIETIVDIDDSGITNTNKYFGTDAGSFAATVYDDNVDEITGATVTWSSSDESVATIDASTGAVTLVNAGTTTITASYAGDDTYQPSSETYELTVTNVNPYLTTIWSEDFSSYSADDVPSGGTYSYACTNGGGTTKIYADSNAGGTSPELLVAKSNGTFSATIPLLTSTYCYNGDLTLTYKTNAYSLNVKTTTTGLTVDGEASAGAGLTFNTKETHTITFKGVTTSTENITIVFTATTGSNVRLDDIVLKGEQAALTKVATPVINPASGAVASGTEVTITCATEGATIKYSYDNTTWNDYSSALTITEDKTVYAKGIKEGLTDSDVASTTYTIATPCATPTFDPVAGEVEKGTTVTISTATDGATIYYTTNGTDPTTSSSIYSSAITINSAMTIKAMAVKDGMANSEIASASYTVIDYATLPFIWAGGTKDALAAVTGVTTYGLGSDYAEGNAPYRVKMDGEGDYIQVKTDVQPVKVTIGVKMIGGDYLSKIKVQESSNGETFNDLHEFEISGSQNDILNFETTNPFNYGTRYIRIIKSTHGSNIGVGPITIFTTTTIPVNATTHEIESDVTVADGYVATIESQTIIPSGRTLTVNGRIVNNLTSNLVIKDGGQLKTANGVRCQMEKNFTGYENYTGTGNGGYYLVATHVDGSAADFYEENPNDIDLYWFEQDNEGAEWRNAKASGIGMVAIQRTKGYLYARKTTGTVVIGRHDYGNACLATNDNQDVTIYYHTGKVFTGVNLIGNPFTCDAYINRDYYRMNAAGDAIIAAASATTAIKPGEGIFVVAANSEDNKVTFTTTAPSSSAAPGEVNITLNQAQTRGEASIIDVARISFSEGNNLPKLNLLGESTMLYIPQGSKDYSVVCSNGQGEMPLNFKAAENGSYTLSFSIENVEMDYMHLIDNMTGADIDLLQTPSYTFNARTTDYASRFRLVFNATGSMPENTEGSETFAFFNGSEWVVNASANATLQVVDMMGRIVLSTNGANTVSTNGMAQGVYVMRLVNGNDVKTQKIVVQ